MLSRVVPSSVRSLCDARVVFRLLEKRFMRRQVTHAHARAFDDDDKTTFLDLPRARQIFHAVMSNHNVASHNSSNLCFRSHHFAPIDIYHRGKAKKGLWAQKRRFVNRQGNILTLLCV